MTTLELYELGAFLDVARSSDIKYAFAEPRSLSEHGLVAPGEALTDRGRAFLQALLATPLPVASWVDPRFSGAAGPQAEYQHQQFNVGDFVVGNTQSDAPAREVDAPAALGVAPLGAGFTMHDGTAPPPIWDPAGKAPQPDVEVAYRGLAKPKQARKTVLPFGSINWKWGKVPHNDDVVGYRIFVAPDETT